LSDKVFTPVQPGQYIPIAGFQWRVESCDATTMVLKVAGVSKSGEKRGFKIHWKDPNELDGENKL
jgi:hypothetical protein